MADDRLQGMTAPVPVSGIRDQELIGEGQRYFEELRESEHAVGLLIVKNEEDFTIIHAGRNLIHFLGYRTGEFNGRFLKMTDLVYPPELGFLHDSLASQLNTSSFFEVRIRILNKEGKLVWVLSKGYRAAGGQGQEYLIHVLIEEPR